MEPTNALCPRCLTYFPENITHVCSEALGDKPPLPPQEINKPLPTPTAPQDPITDLMADAAFAMNLQTSGGHYQRGTIQPIEFFHDSNLPFIEASVMKHVYRWRDKGGLVDLKKAIHLIFQLIALEERKKARLEMASQRTPV